MWHIKDDKYPQWVFFLVEDACEYLPPVKMFLSQLNLRLGKKEVSDSLPKDGWSSVKFEIQRSEGNLRCFAMSMHDFARYVKIRQGVS